MTGTSQIRYDSSEGHPFYPMHSLIHRSELKADFFDPDYKPAIPGKDTTDLDVRGVTTGRAEFVADTGNDNDIENAQALPEAHDTDAQPKAIQDNWHSLATSDLTDATFSKIEKISALPNEWRGPGSSKLSPSSLRRFLQLWKLISGDAAEPFLSLTPNGNLYAEWHASWRRHLDVEFTADGQIYFGFFHNSNVLEGKLKFDDFHAMITGCSQNPFRWRR